MAPRSNSENLDRRLRRRTTRIPISLITILILGSTWAWLGAVSLGKLSVRILPSGEQIEFSGEGPQEWYKDTIPLHHSGSLRYFSAGVGIEEREAEYPPFPLKIIFVQGEKAYVSHVAVTLENEAGTIRLAIPENNAKGPWLFVDLPDGTYTLTAIWNGQTVERKGVTVRSDSAKTVYLRWP